MSWFAICTLRRSQLLVRSVFVVIATLLLAVPICTAQAMQKGISVDLPVTSSAVSIPDAEREGALIVSITEGGSAYFGTNPISPSALRETVQSRLSNQTEKTLYIKADARTPYANVLKVLDAVRTVGVEPTLLTAQPDSPEAGTVMPPKGFDVLLGPPSASESIVLQLLNSGQRRPTLKINNEPIAWANLQTDLRQLLHSRSEKMFLIKADGLLPFAQVVEVMDACNSTGAKVVLITPGL